MPLRAIAFHQYRVKFDPFIDMRQADRFQLIQTALWHRAFNDILRHTTRVMPAGGD